MQEIGGLRFCDRCSMPLTPDVLLAQAEQLLAPFAGAKLEDVQCPVGDLLRRAAGPVNDGIDRCYVCAYGESGVALTLVP